ncbi:MAG: hypothetical protein WCI54_11880, partial [Bacteroidia bacterium]
MTIGRRPAAIYTNQPTNQPTNQSTMKTQLFIYLKAFLFLLIAVTVNAQQWSAVPLVTKTMKDQ